MHAPFKKAASVLLSVLRHNKIVVVNNGRLTDEAMEQVRELLDNLSEMSIRHIAEQYLVQEVLRQYEERPHRYAH